MDIIKGNRIHNRILRQLYNVYNKSFWLCQKIGFNIVPNHFYYPIPDLNDLDKHDWKALSKLEGVNLNLNKQLDILRNYVPKYINECDFPKQRTSIPYEFFLNNGYFESVDAEILHTMIRHFKPNRIVEIGSGYSTYLSARSCRMNNEIDCVRSELFAIDQYPKNTLRKGIPGLTKLINKPVEQVDLSFFQELNQNDILFIDSSHVIKIANDVLYEYLNILPILKKGVIIHIHDIFLPAEYPKEWVFNLGRFWTEQYLLQSFLCFNNAFEVLWSSSAMHFYYHDELESMFPGWKGSYINYPKQFKMTTPTYDKINIWPCSFWIRKIE